MIKLAYGLATTCFVFTVTAMAQGQVALSEKALVDRSSRWATSVDLSVGDYSYKEPGLMKISGGMTGFNISPVYSIENTNQFIIGNFQYMRGDTQYEGSTFAGDPLRVGNTDYFYTIGGTYSFLLDAPDVGGYLDLGVGLAHRYLKNDNPSRDREQTYNYAPLNIGLNSKLSNNWRIRAGFELAVFLNGKNKTHWEQVHPELDTVTYRQKSGSGRTLSMAVMQKLENIELKYSLSYQTWNIGESDHQMLKTKSGAVAQDSEGRGWILREPKNETSMLSFGIGAIF